MSVSACVPATVVAGDTLSFADAAAWAAYPPGDWSLIFALRLEAGGPVQTFAALDVASAYKVTIPAATTAAFAPGRWVWSLVAEHDTDGTRATWARGGLDVTPDPLAATGDTRSDAVRILAAITATIEGRVTKDADSYSIEGRSITRTPMADLLRLRNLYTRIVARERGARGLSYRRIAF